MNEEQSTVEQGLSLRHHELGVLHRLGREALRNMTCAEMVGLALDEVMAAIVPDLAFLYGADHGNLVLQGVRPGGADIGLPEKKRSGECLCGLAALDRKPIFSTNIDTDSRCTLPECKAARLHSFAALPLHAEDELVGVLGLGSTTARDFAGQESFLVALAATIALALKKALAFQEHGQRIIDLENQLADRTSELAIRNSELERLNRIFVDREFRIKALKDQLKSLQHQG